MLLSAAAVLLSLTSCASTASSDPNGTDTPAPATSAVPAGAIDHMFTIRYDADHTLNPITGTDPNNMALAPLMYEGLFVLNGKLTAEPVLCESFDPGDGVTYTFKLKSGIAMSDGSTLTAADVKYTLLLAKQSGRFSGRLNILDSVTAVDGLTVKVTLNSANYMLPELLDIPIIKANSGNQDHPAGTGPYTFASSGEPRLVAFSSYRESANIPAPVIYLKSCTDSELSMEFSSQAVDMFWDDPADTTDINILSDHEIRYYDTTILEYVGFNTKSRGLSSPELRRALGLTIDRDKIIDEVYSNHAVAAPRILSPNYSHYDPAWAPEVDDALGDISKILFSLDLDDRDSDGYLEMQDAAGAWHPLNLTFIVNKDNLYKVRAAQEIADSLKEVGINVMVKSLSWSDYTSALEKGNFDLYYGDVCLPADYDLTELLSPSGALSFGHIGSTSYITYINAFLKASSDTARTAAAKALCDEIYTNAPIVPVLYRQYAVHTNRNIVTGLNPTQSSLFYGLTSWKINLGE